MDSINLHVLRCIIDWLNEGYQASLVTVVKTWGSSPRPIGSILGIRQDGALIGSVSGGCIEDDLIAHTLSKSIDESRPQLLTYGVTREESQRFGLPCGGTLQLVIEPLHDANSLQQILNAIEQGLIVSRNLDMQTGQLTIQSASYKQTLSFDGKGLKTVFGPRWHLLIIGAAQVSHYLADMALSLDYQVTVCDPREAYLATWPLQKTPIIQRMPDDVIRELMPNEHTAIVCLSHDPKLDDMALLEALISDAFYVGAIGSHSNNEKRRERMAMFDISDDEIDRLHGPIGLRIGSKTPPEIAISILAEITAIRHGINDSNSSQIASKPAEKEDNVERVAA